MRTRPRGLVYGRRAGVDIQQTPAERTYLAGGFEFKKDGIRLTLSLFMRCSAFFLRALRVGSTA
jgi:hypothetical protein